MEEETRTSKTVVDGSDKMTLVEDGAVFSIFVEDKFQQLDLDKDGKLSQNELHWVVANLGAALGLPAQGSSPDSYHIYSEDGVDCDHRSTLKKALVSGQGNWANEEEEERGAQE